MRIAFAISGLADDLGGPPRSALGMARALARRGHALTVFTTDTGLHSRSPGLAGRTLERDGFEIAYHRVLFPEKPHISLPLTVALRHLREFDVMHAHGVLTYVPTAAMVAARLLRVPYVVRPLGILTEMNARKRLALALVESANLRHAGRVHFATEMERQAAGALGISIRSEVIPQGVDVEPTAAERTPSAPSVLFLGRLHPQKGFDVLLPAFRRVAEAMPGLRLTIAGPDSNGYSETLGRMCRAEGLDGRVDWLGPLEGPAKWRALAQATLLALPSHGESFSMVVAEAAAAGTPVVVSDRVGLAPDVARLGAGEVAPLSVDAFAAAMRRVLGGDRQELKLGSQRLAEHLSWEKAAERIERMYEAVLQEAGRRGSRP